MDRIKTLTGEILIDGQKCLTCPEKPCLAACLPQILKEEGGRPVLAIPAQEAARGKCIECLACELDCHQFGKGGLTISLPLPELAG